MAEKINSIVELSPERYFPDHYLQDLENWILHSTFPDRINSLSQPRPHSGIGSICDFPHRHKVFETQAYKDFNSFTDFICVTYELNLLNFAIYEHAEFLFDEWKSKAAPFLETHGYEHSYDIRISSDELIRYFCDGVPTRLDHLLPVRHFQELRQFAPSTELLKSYDEFFVPIYAEGVCGSSYSLLMCDAELKAAELDYSPTDLNALIPLAKRNFGERLLQTILRDPDCSTFRARNLERLKLTEIEQILLELHTKKGIADPLGELIERRSKVSHCRNKECHRVFLKTRKGQHFCSFKCRDAYDYRPDSSIQLENELYAEMIGQLEKEIAEMSKAS